MSESSAPSFWLPSQGSTTAPAVDDLFHLILWISTGAFVVIAVLLVWFLWRYRRREGHEALKGELHNDALELAWSIAPALFLAVIFWRGFTGFLDMRTTPRDAYEVQVSAQKWAWSFTYPNGYVTSELHVPAGRPVRLLLASEDVIHSLFIPDMRVKQDVVPGRFTETWFEAKAPGEHPLLCAEYCGTRHSMMTTRVVVHERAAFDRWLLEASDLLARMSPEDAGRTLYEERGCTQCHTIDGSPRVGPTFKGLFGRERPLAGGARITADENYVRESILEPLAKVADGFQPVMPTYRGRLSDREIGAVISFLKTLAEKKP